MILAKIKCTCCGTDKINTREFYASNSYLYRNIGRIPVCKSCIEEKYNSLINDFKDKKLSAMKMFLSLNVYFDEDLFDSVLTKCPDDNKWIGEYMRIINSNARYKSKNGYDTGEIEIPVIEECNCEESEYRVSDSIKRKWGDGFTDREYTQLEYLEKEYLDNCEHDTLTQVKLYRELCVLELERDKARTTDKKAFKDYSELISKKMTDANIKPNQQKVIGEADEDLLSMRTKMIEKYRPIGNGQTEFEDVDHIQKYFNDYIIKSLAMNLGLAKGEFSLDENDDTIVLDEKLENAMTEVVKDE